MAVTEYSWDDPDAPPLFDAVAGTALNFWKKILVEGYGSKPSAGWSLAFEDGHIGVFQNADQDAFFRLDGSDAGRYFHMKLFLTMSDAHTGTDPAPGNSENSGQGMRCDMGYLSHTAARDYKWKVWADEYTVYLYTWGFGHNTVHDYARMLGVFSTFGRLETVFGSTSFVKLSYVTSQTAYVGLDSSMPALNYYQLGGEAARNLKLATAFSNGYLAYDTQAYTPVMQAGFDMTDNPVGQVVLCQLQASTTGTNFNTNTGFLFRGAYEALWNAKADLAALEDPNTWVHYFTHEGRPFVRLLFKGGASPDYARAVVLALDDWG